MNPFSIDKTDDRSLMFDLLYQVENYFTFNVKVRSGEFRGASSFCISREDMLQVIDQLSFMSEKLTGSCIINDSDSDSFISFEMERHGHLSISGQLGGSHQDHMVKFKYASDQTMLEYFLETFNLAMNAPE